MLVISHRGAAGLARENTLEALRAGQKAGADILEIDIRLTRDGIPVLMHDFIAFRTHRDATIISRHTLHELKERFSDQPIFTLEEVLKEFFGKVLLNIEAKGRGSGKIIIELVKKDFIKKPADWDKVLFSSFNASELTAIRRGSKDANLSLLHSINPFLFIAHNRKLRLTAVGFHRLYASEFAIEIAKRSGIFTYVYTVDRPHTALLFSRKGIDGVVTNRPDIILKEITKRSGK